MNIIKVKALRGFGVGGGVFAIPGEVVSLREADALLRVMQGKAIIYNEAEKAQKPLQKQQIKEVKRNESR